MHTSESVTGRGHSDGSAAGGPRPGGTPSVPHLLERMRAGDREAAAIFLMRYGPLVRRRARGKLGRATRAVFDSQDILSTVGRRLDAYVAAGRLQVEDEAQLWAVVNKMTDGAVTDKNRALRRLRSVERGDAAVAELIEPSLTADDQEAARISLDRIVRQLDDDDRSILSLRVAGNDFRIIGECVGMSEGAVRVRWLRIRHRLAEQLRGDA